MTPKDEVSTESLGGFLEEMTPKLHLQGEVGSWLTRLTKDKNNKCQTLLDIHACLYVFHKHGKKFQRIPPTTGSPTGDGENEGLLISAFSSLIE